MHADMTDRARKALAELVNELRASAHLPAWDVPGVAAAISRARSKAPADEVAIALLRLASRADLRSPAVLADEGPHWRDLEQHARTIRPSDAPKCPIHLLPIIRDDKCSGCFGDERGMDDDSLAAREARMRAESEARYEASRRAREAAAAALRRTPTTPERADEGERA